MKNLKEIEKFVKLITYQFNTKFIWIGKNFEFEINNNIHLCSI